MEQSRDSNDFHSIEKSEIGKPIPGPELEKHVARLSKRNEGGYTGYEEEYFVLDQRSDNNFFGDFQEALKHVNRAKNRYSNVLPLDRTRVVLCGSDEPGSDYINANYVDGVYEKQYIATQGPLKETAEDFWRMVWEQEMNVLVMLTKITENSKVKCYKYWPGKAKGKVFGRFTVNLMNKEKEHGLVVRTISLTRNDSGSELKKSDCANLRNSKGGVDLDANNNASLTSSGGKHKDGGGGSNSNNNSGGGGGGVGSGGGSSNNSSPSNGLVHENNSQVREIYHFQYKEWPDHGLPSSAATFRHLLHLVDAMHDRRGPILVHCSAGIGRTGTFCAVHTITQNLDRHIQEHPNVETMPPPTFNIFETILKLRTNRVGMVQTKDQFEFCYKAVLEEYQGRLKQLAAGSEKKKQKNEAENE